MACGFIQQRAVYILVSQLALGRKAPEPSQNMMGGPEGQAVFDQGVAQRNRGGKTIASTLKHLLAVHNERLKKRGKQAHHVGGAIDGIIGKRRAGELDVECGTTRVSFENL